MPVFNKFSGLFYWHISCSNRIIIELFGFLTFLYNPIDGGMRAVPVGLGMTLINTGQRDLQMTTPADVLKMIKEKDVKFVDYRFTDTHGKQQHVTVMAASVDEEVFESGKMFDGSSIAGWKGINDSDMILMPDAETAAIDPFYDETTLDLVCDVIEPSTMQVMSAIRARWLSALKLI